MGWPQVREAICSLEAPKQCPLSFSGIHNGLFFAVLKTQKCPSHLLKQEFDFYGWSSEL